MLDNWKKKTDGDGNATDAGKDQSMFILTILEKIQETRLKYCSSVTKDGKLSTGQN